MALSPSTKLGPYEIESAIGAGGMGEVYRARDTRLDRTVAIKVLPEHFSKDPARRERFEREARAVSSLNHPHICTLHDVGEHDGVHFLVMEHIDGETLADRLKQGAVPLAQALEYAAQIAGALDKAHRAGIVHRDLKPGNIMLTKPGVKLLDFGLAKTREENAVPSHDSEQPTQNKPLTDAGTILGTVQYMAPEQLEGKEVDARADLFALGAVLFEMVTGRKAFEGESLASLISAIMSSDVPSVSKLQPVAPPGLDRVVKTCLAKDPDERWHSAHDVAMQLEWIAHPDANGVSQSVGKRRWLPWAFAAVAAFAAAILGSSRPTSTPPEVARFELGLDSFITSWAPGMVLSPDGKYLVYRSSPPTQLRVRPLDSLNSRILEGSERASNPFFSPDSAWVAFRVEQQLRKTSIEGGRSQVIGELPLGRTPDYSASWNQNDSILLATGGGLYRYAADGGTRETVVELESAVGELLHPRWLPDARHALVTLKVGAQTTIFVVDVETGEMQELMASGSQANYLPSGHLVFRVRDGALSELYAVSFDADRLRLTGSPVALPHAVFAIESAGGGYFAVSESGHLAFLPAGTTLATSLQWAETGGATQLLDIEPGVFRRPSLSPDGQRIAVDSHTGGAFEHDIWIYDIQTGSRTRFTVPGHNATPVWTPDGARVTFASRRPRTPIQSIYSKGINGDEEAELLVEMDFPTYPVSWSPDGQHLAFVVSGRDTQDDIWVLPRGQEPEPLVVTAFNEHSPMFSPDGSWLAYVSEESGREEVYVRPFPGEGPKQAVSTSGGREPMWSRDGRKLFLRSADGSEMWSADVELVPAFRTTKPELVFSRRFLVDWNREQSYDVSADGQRFLMIEEIEESAQSEAVVVLNWVEEVKRLVPTEN